jgi:voltage-gated sodium channel
LDGTLVIFSIPSIIEFFIPVGMVNMSFLLILRLLRVLRFFRVLHFFPNFSKVVAGFKTALKQSYAILLSFFIIIVIFGLINCSLFKDADPEHFQTPLRSIYAVFQICTVEGWYEIPNAVAEYYGNSTVAAECVRVYFCFILLLGGIIGMSFINSIFVDAMVADNNNELEEQVKELNAKIDRLLEQQNNKD